MPASTRSKSRLCCLLTNCLVLLAIAGARAPRAAAADGAALAEKFLSRENVRPGLCVYVGGADVGLMLALREHGYLVHGITADAKALPGLREAIQAKEAYGPVSVDVASMEYLPYAINIVNLLIVDDFPARAAEGLTAGDILRVLAPYGSAFLESGPAETEGVETSRMEDGWVQLTKPYTEGMDEFLNSEARLSKDRLVGPPTALRWITGEYWCGKNSWGYSRVVSAGGRVFYRFNVERGYGFKTGYEQKMFRYVARDAFNGLKLWERLQPDTGAELLQISEGRLLISRRTRTVLDPATGEEVAEEEAERLIRNYQAVPCDGLLIFHGRLRAVDAETGKEVWRGPDGWDYGGPMGDGKMFLNMRLGRDKTHLGVCVDIRTGKKLWQHPKGRYILYRDGNLFRRGRRKQRTIPDPRDGTKTIDKWYGVVGAVSTEDGTPLWEHEFPLPVHGGTDDSWYMEGLLWVHAGFDDRSEVKVESWQGLDPKTGDVKRTLLMPSKVKHRCSPHHATEKYILANGMELFCPSEGRVYGFYGLRNACKLGYIPANGMLYSAPTVCECFPHLRGVGAVAADPIPSWEDMKERAVPDFVKGPAFGKAATLAVAESDWPTYRHDPLRTGATSVSVPVDVKQLWATAFGKRVSAPTVAGGLVFVSVIDEHRVLALDAATGQERWSYTVAGRVDTPPTIHDGLALFGGRDGWAYCLTADAGQLVWKFRAAPEDKRTVERGQVESSWPLFGTVLVLGDVAIVAAGRHSEVDGGIFMYALEPATGAVKWKKQIIRANLHAQASRSKIGNEMNDILNGDETAFLMQWKWFDPKDGSETTTQASVVLTGGRPGWIADIAGPPIGWKHDFQQERRGAGVRATIINFFEDMTYSIDKDTAEVYCRDRRNRGGWTAKMPKDTRQKALLVTPETVFVTTLPDDTDFTRGEVWMYSTAGGEPVGKAPLPAAPAFEAIAATPGRLFVTTQDGQVVCLGK